MLRAASHASGRGCPDERVLVGRSAGLLLCTSPMRGVAEHRGEVGRAGREVDTGGRGRVGAPLLSILPS
jgi:hypothetical protein